MAESNCLTAVRVRGEMMSMMPIIFIDRPEIEQRMDQRRERMVWIAIVP
jgi:hypothetical protein